MFKINFLIFILFFSYFSVSADDCAVSFEELPIEERKKEIDLLVESGVQTIQDFLELKTEFEALGIFFSTGLFKHYKKYLQNNNSLSEQSYTPLEEKQEIEEEPAVRNSKKHEENTPEVLDLGNVDLSFDSKKLEYVTLEELQKIEKEEGGFESRRKYQEIIPYLTKKYNRRFPTFPNPFYKLKKEEGFFQKQPYVTLEELQKIEEEEGGFESRRKYQKIIPYLTKKHNKRFPTSPNGFYKLKKGEGFFQKQAYVTLEELQKIEKEEGGFESRRKYQEIIPYLTKKHNKRFPTSPNKFYKLKEGEKFFQKLLIVPFTEAKKLMIKYKVGSQREYKKVRLEIQELENINLPSKPERVYKKVWRGWDDFLGKQSIVSLEEAEKIVRKYGVRNRREYEKMRPEIQELEGVRLPDRPDRYYDKWKDWYDFLGK